MGISTWLAWNFPLSGKVSQSYEGEDILLWRLFTEEIPVKNGFFIDVGAFHPRLFNNTWLLKKRLGFKGVNIEPSIKGYKQFKRWRKDDINLNILCGDLDGIDYYNYNEKEPALSHIGWGTQMVTSLTLKTICKKYSVNKIDLLSIDVEGYEYWVLRGHNWDIKPKVIICELNDKGTNEYILKKGYKLYAKTKRNGIYVS